MSGSVSRSGSMGRSVLSRLLAGATLTLLIVGVPIWLGEMGGIPFAHLFPEVLWAAVVHRRGGDPRQVVDWLGRVALLAAWAAWLWAAVCVLVEVRSWVSGRAPSPLPASRTLQWVVACLVSTTLAVGVAGRVPLHIDRVGAPGAGGHDPVPVVQVVDFVAAPLVRTVAVVADPGRLDLGVGDRTSSAAVADRAVLVGADASRAVTERRLEPLAEPQGEPVSVPEAEISAPAEDRRVLHTVTARETLWSVAERRLGSAQRWREIAQLNYGRVQADGGALCDDHWIRPGWSLTLPSSATPTATPTAARDTGNRESLEPDPVGAEEGLWSPVGTPAHRSVEWTTVDCRPHVASGTITEAIPESPVGPVEPMDPVEPMGSVGPIAPARTSRSAEPMQPVAPLGPVMPVVPVGAGIMGVGVTDLVDRLRKVQQRHRESGSLIRLPGPLLRQFEQRLRVGDGASVLQAVQDAVLLLFESDVGASAPPPVLGVKVSNDSVHLVFGADVPSDGILSPFTRTDAPTELSIDRVVLDLAASRLRGGSRGPFPLPTLVTVGRTDDDVVLMVNTVGLGSLVIGGEPRGAEGVARALAMELATSHWSSQFDLVLVGFGAGFDRFDRVTVVSEAGPLIADLSWRRLRDRMLLDERGFSTATEARCGDAGVAWDPLVVVCGPGVPASEAAALLELCRDGTCGMGAVVVGANVEIDQYGPARTVLAGPELNPSSLTLFGELLLPQQIGTQDVDQVYSLLDTSDCGSPSLGPVADGDYASDDDTSDGTDSSWSDNAPADARTVGVRGGEVLISAYASASPGSSVPVAPPRVVGPTDGLATDGRLLLPTIPPAVQLPIPDRTDRVPEVEVAVLGPIEIRGASREFTRAWARELVVYLAMHPNGASNEVWATALWPERMMAPSSLHSTASVARRSLGKSHKGEDHLPRSHGRLALAPSVGTDWDRFLELADTEDTVRWREALELVRGRPFEGMRSTDWAILDGTAPAIESAIVDLSGRLAGACLREGDPRGAEWAARRGLVVSPYDERLYRMLMRAADAAGNPSGVESVMAELVRVVADEIEPIESVHPSTLALYRSLSRKRVPKT
ncbi:MAG: BTAD domain-containing putative transcriptional regulator [Acidimicrobiales bacterium]